jgi:hypothetical protein
MQFSGTGEGDARAERLELGRIFAQAESKSRSGHWTRPVRSADVEELYLLQRGFTASEVSNICRGTLVSMLFLEATAGELL